MASFYSSFLHFHSLYNFYIYKISLFPITRFICVIGYTYIVTTAGNIQHLFDPSIDGRKKRDKSSYSFLHFFFFFPFVLPLIWASNIELSESLCSGVPKRFKLIGFLSSTGFLACALLLAAGVSLAVALSPFLYPPSLYTSFSSPTRSPFLWWFSSFLTMIRYIYIRSIGFFPPPFLCLSLLYFFPLSISLTSSPCTPPPPLLGRSVHSVPLDWYQTRTAAVVWSPFDDSMRWLALETRHTGAVGL